MAEFLDLAAAVEANVRDGDSVAFEGFTHLIPYAAGHEVIRQGRRDLTLIRMTPDLIYDQMIGMGAARKLVFSCGGNPGVGSLRRMRDAVENGWPRPLEIEEHSHAAMANAYEAGAAGLPCAIFRGYRGADLPKVNPNIKSVTCPFTGEVLAAVPAIRPDVTFIHAQKPTANGNVLIEGIIGVQKEAVLAARRAIVTVEEVVDDFGPRIPNAVILPAWTVAAIAVVPGGAHPSYAHGYYARDNASYLAWDEIAARPRQLSRLDGGECASKAGRTTLPPHGRRGIGGMSDRFTPDRDDDDRRRPRARQRRRLLRRHRRAVGGLQRRAADARARHHADLRVRHDRHRAGRAAAVDRRRRACANRAHHRLGAGDVPLLAAGRAHHRSASSARADRPIRQHQHHGHRRLRDSPRCGCRAAAARRRSPPHCSEIYITMAQGKRAMVEKIDFITSFGHGDGGDHRQRLGIDTKGPTLLITDLCDHGSRTR